MDRLHNGDVARVARMSQSQPEPFGPFLLVSRIAVGGSAEVYLARPREGNQPAPRLVVKRLLPVAREASDFGVLESEALLHQAVQHPNVVKVFGAGLVQGEPYIAMEYVEGVDAYGLLRRSEEACRPVPPNLAVHIVRQVADALESVHTATDPAGRPLHIVHRDVTPSNIYLSVRGDTKVGDFGIARASLQRRPPSAPSQELKGKFGYLAPEQVAAEPFDHRADLFSLSAILGEMLIGERVFPGHGELAVLLAIRDGNLEPLRAKAHLVPEGLLPILERGLALHPSARFSCAAEFSRALMPFEQPSPQELRDQLAQWVSWARGTGLAGVELENRIRDSVRRMRAVRLGKGVSSGAMHAGERATARALSPAVARVRRANAKEVLEVTSPTLLEMLATGELCWNDEVALADSDFRPVLELSAIGRLLLPSTSVPTRQLFEPGVPDYQAMLADTALSAVLARVRRDRETGALFVQRRDHARPRREVYVSGGRLLHVAASERDELLGEYLVRRGVLDREQLELALREIAHEGGRLGDTLVAMGSVTAVDVFRAIRDLGRDRVATICSWREGHVTFYRGTVPGRVDFPLDLDLASPMMAGVIVASGGQPRALLPAGFTLLAPGPRFHETNDPRERGTAPSSLQLLPALVPEKVSVDQAIARLTALRAGRGRRTVTDKEACAALVTAVDLGWVRFEA
ncbi:serine/threonine protein kinase [Myxococcota bacterium]